MTATASVAGNGLDVVPAVVQDFRAGLRGALLQPGDDGYDAARRVWNGAIDRRPALIARCTGAADVIRAVNFARSNDLLVSVRGGGHNVTGNAVCDGGLMIDLSPMKGIRVDVGRRTVQAQAGLTWGELDHETQAFGLATTGGQISTTGIAGLTLGGGLGWLMRKCGLAVDNLISVDLVTADGRFLTCSATEHADLFWGLRGGGGNLGLATSFEYRLHSIGPLVTGGIALYPAAQAEEALHVYREYMAAASDDEMVALAFQSAPPAPFVPAHLHGAPVVAFALCHVGPLDEGRRAVERLRAFGPPVVDLLGPMPYTAVQQMFDDGMPFGRHVYLRSDHLTGLSDEVIKLCVQHAAAVTSPRSVIVIIPIGGAVARVGEHDTAFSHRDTPFDIDIFAIWTDPRESDRHVQWGRSFGEALRPFSKGVYVNEMGIEGEDRIRAAYNAANYARLVELKNMYDPTNFWRLNQNIKPTV
jgi:FAD binding domain/Berberine and berberine like